MNEKLELRPFEDRDIEKLRAWLQKPHISRWFEHPDSWINEVRHRHDAFSFVHHFILTADGRDIGFCQYYDYEKGGEDFHGTLDITNTYSIDYMISEEAYLGRHIGTRLVALLEERLLADTAAEKVIVQPDPDNHASRNTLLSLGYSYDSGNDLLYKLLR